MGHDSQSQSGMQLFKSCLPWAPSGKNFVMSLLLALAALRHLVRKVKTCQTKKLHHEPTQEAVFRLNLGLFEPV